MVAFPVNKTAGIPVATSEIPPNGNGIEQNKQVVKTEALSDKTACAQPPSIKDDESPTSPRTFAVPVSVRHKLPRMRAENSVDGIRLDRPSVRPGGLKPQKPLPAKDQTSSPAPSTTTSIPDLIKLGMSGFRCHRVEHYRLCRDDDLRLCVILPYEGRVLDFVEAAGFNPSSTRLSVHDSAALRVRCSSVGILTDARLTS